MRISFSLEAFSEPCRNTSETFFVHSLITNKTLQTMLMPRVLSKEQLADKNFMEENNRKFRRDLIIVGSLMIFMAVSFIWVIYEKMH